MSYLILINETSAKVGYTSPGDFVDCVDGEVRQSEAYDIIEIPYPAEEVKAVLFSKIPARRVALRHKTPENTWTFDEPERREVWNDSGIWKEVVERKHYPLNIDKSVIAAWLAGKEVELSGIENAISRNIDREENQKIIPVTESESIRG